jgi:hypothetical protein
MQTDQNKIEKLLEFKCKDKFSTQAWNDRGLNPSSDELCRQLTSFFDTSADKLINRIQDGSSNKQLKALLKSEIASLDKSNYDTEEKEFICDLFH